MLYKLSVVISIAAVFGVAALTGFMIWTWAKQSREYKDEPEKLGPLKPRKAVPERKYIGKRYTGPELTQETVLEYLVEFRTEDGTLHTIVVPYNVWKGIELGKKADLLVQKDETFLDFDHLA